MSFEVTICLKVPIFVKLIKCKEYRLKFYIKFLPIGPVTNLLLEVANSDKLSSFIRVAPYLSLNILSLNLGSNFSAIEVRIGSKYHCSAFGLNSRIDPILDIFECGRITVASPDI